MPQIPSRCEIFRWHSTERAQPRWRSDGDELYYVQGETLMAVSVSTGEGVTVGQPQVLFEDLNLRGEVALTTSPPTASGS